jgi:hypothetical protein
MLARAVKKDAMDFWYSMGKICIGSFCPLLQSTQEKIRKALDRLCNDLAHVLGRNSLSYSEFIQLVREYYGPGKMPWSFAQSITASIFPGDINASDIPSMDFLIDQEKLEAALASSPEPAPEALEKLLKMLDDALPLLRKSLLKQTKALPHGRGGAPRKLASAADQAKVIEEIKSLRGPGIKLEDVLKRVAQRHGVSASKIKQMWLSAKKEAPHLPESD